MRTRMFVVALGIVFALWAATPAQAGNIAITGHDDDFHCSLESPVGVLANDACAQIKEMVTLASNGSGLPILTFDAGTELTTSLTDLGISFVNVNPNVAGNVTDALFDNTKYSAFVVASDTTCGGCDNNAGGEANIAAHSTAIDNFLNAGGGIVGLAGAFSPAYYSFLPEVASSVGGAFSDGYSATGVDGITAVNGDATHNLFWNPGTHGESSAYVVAETSANPSTTTGGPGAGAAVTLVCNNCTTSGGVLTSGVPEPSAFIPLVAGFAGIAFRMRKKIFRG